jgi:hypothetical protein
MDQPKEHVIDCWTTISRKMPTHMERRHIGIAQIPDQPKTRVIFKGDLGKERFEEVRRVPAEKAYEELQRDVKNHLDEGWQPCTLPINPK